MNQDKTVEISSSRLKELEAKERKLAEFENELINKSEMYDFVFSNSSVGILVYDSNGKVTDCNEEHLKILGTSKDKVIGLNLLDDLTDAKVKKKIKESLELKETTSFSGTYMSHTSKKVVYINSIFKPIVENNSTKGGIALTYDTTNENKYKLEIQRKEDKYKKLINTIPGTVYIISYSESSEKIKIKFISQRVEDITGVKVTDFMEDKVDVFDLIHPDDVERVFNGFKNSPQIETYYKLDFRAKIKSGDYIWVETYGSRIFEEGTSDILLQGLIVNVNESVLASQMLKENQAKLQSILDYSPFSISSLESNYKLDIFNKQYLDYIKTYFKIENVQKGTNLLECVPLEKRDYWKHYIDKAFEGKADKVIRSYYDEKIRYFETYYNPIYKEDEIIQVLIVTNEITDRIEQENELVKAKTAIENTTNAIALFEKSWSLLFANQAFLNLWGYEIEEIKMFDFKILFTQESYSELKNFQHKLENEHQKNSYNKVYGISKKGRKFPLSISAVLMKDDFGNIIGTTITFRDITKDLEMIKELAQQQSFFNQSVNNTPNIIFLVNEKLNLLNTNKAFENAFGTVDHENGLFSIVHNDGSEEILREKVELAFQGDSTSGIELNFIDKENNILETLSRVYPVFDDKKVVQYVVVANTNITTIKQSERMLLESEERFKMLYLSIPNAILILDYETNNIIDCNDFACETYSYTHEEFIGLHLDDITADYNKALNTLDFISRNKSIFLPLRYHRKKNGAIFPIEISAGFYTSMGKSYYYIVGRDISTRLQAESNLRRSEQMLKEALESKNKFFNIIAHDLKSPLSGVLDLSKMLSKDLNSFSLSEISSNTRELYDSAKQLFRLLENLLEWSRTQTGNMKLNQENYNLFQLIKLSTEIFYNNLKIKKIKLEVNCDDDIYTYCDAKMTETVIRNLISNAIKFTPEEGKITINAKENERDIIVSVIDTGIGIKESDINKLFKIDTNFTTKGTNQEKGTGLGLVLSKELVELQGGKLKVESKENQGTTFTFTLPKANYEF